MQYNHNRKQNIYIIQNILVIKAYNWNAVGFFLNFLYLLDVWLSGNVLIFHILIMNPRVYVYQFERYTKITKFISMLRLCEFKSFMYVPIS